MAILKSVFKRNMIIMKYANFWKKFRDWALTVNHDEIPYKLRGVVKIIRENPNISLVGLAGYLDTDAVYLAKFLYNSFREITDSSTP